MKSYRGIVYQQDGPAAMSKHSHEGGVICKACLLSVFNKIAVCPCLASFTRVVGMELTISRR